MPFFEDIFHFSTFLLIVTNSISLIDRLKELFQLRAREGRRDEGTKDRACSLLNTSSKDPQNEKQRCTDGRYR